VTAGTGLRRFVNQPGQPATPRPAQDEAPVEEKCEMCATPVGSRHGHVVDIENRSLICACRACFLLFTRETAGGGRYRAVPERYLHDIDRPLTSAEWEGLGIPVASAFFLRGDDGIAGFYPSPAGATECLLDLQAWADLSERHPLLAEARADVEAILIRNADAGVECYLVPIDVCYQLVGTVRMYWKGFDGGEEAHEHIGGLFAEVRDRARRFGPEE
jgi:hypothetical protein